MIDKPYSASCERNRDPILGVLQERFVDRRHVLEIGSGTGQHAAYFAAAMPWLAWQCSDVADHLPGIGMWLDAAGLANTPAPVVLDVAHGPWPAARFDAVFSANTLHIMGWAEVEAFFAGVDGVLEKSSRASSALQEPWVDWVLENPSTSGLRPYAQSLPRTRSGGEREIGDGDGMLVVYGPFNYGGAYSSDSNREFDTWLKARDPRSGLRDFEAVDALAQAIGLLLIDDVAMPANNRCLVWRRDRAPNG